MNRIFILAAILSISAGIAYADNLDEVIIYGFANSAAGKTISNKLGIYKLTYTESWLSLLPELQANVKYNNGAAGSIQSDQWSGSISFSESFSHVDSIVQGLVKSGNQLDINKIQAEIEKRNYIDSVIQAYIALGVSKKEIALLEANIGAKLSTLKVMEVKLKNGQEIALNAKKLSNDIVLLQQDLQYKLAESAKSADQFIVLTSLSNVSPVWDAGQVAVAAGAGTNSQYALNINNKELELANNSIDIGLATREQFLPQLSLSFDYGYDMWEKQTSWGFSAGLSFNLFDFFQRDNKIGQLNYQKDNNEIALDNLKKEFEYSLRLMLKRIEILTAKVLALKSNVEIERELQKLYDYQYKTDQIDYPEYMLRMNTLLEAELSYLRAESELYLLKKRLMYGLVKI